MKNHAIRTMAVLTLFAMLSFGASNVFAFPTNCGHGCIPTLSYAPAAQPTLLSMLFQILSGFWI
jgi:uncharacterized membrane protein